MTVRERIICSSLQRQMERRVWTRSDVSPLSGGKDFDAEYDESYLITGLVMEILAMHED